MDLFRRLLWHNRLCGRGIVRLVDLIHPARQRLTATGAERIHRLVNERAICKRGGVSRPVRARRNERNGLATQAKCNLWCAGRAVCGRYRDVKATRRDRQDFTLRFVNRAAGYRRQQCRDANNGEVCFHVFGV